MVKAAVARAPAMKQRPGSPAPIRFTAVNRGWLGGLLLSLCWHEQREPFCQATGWNVSRGQRRGDQLCVVVYRGKPRQRIGGYQKRSAKQIEARLEPPVLLIGTPSHQVSCSLFRSDGGRQEIVHRGKPARIRATHVRDEPRRHTSVEERQDRASGEATIRARERKRRGLPR